MSALPFLSMTCSISTRAPETFGGEVNQVGIQLCLLSLPFKLPYRHVLNYFTVFFRMRVKEEKKQVLEGQIFRGHTE